MSSTVSRAANSSGWTFGPEHGEADRYVGHVSSRSAAMMGQIDALPALIDSATGRDQIDVRASRCRHGMAATGVPRHDLGGSQAPLN
jgi:hypothetical protein